MNKKEWTVKNTFADNCGNKEFTVGMILCGLQQHVFHYKDLPREAQVAIDAYQAIHATRECKKCHKNYHGYEFRSDGSHEGCRVD